MTVSVHEEKQAEKSGGRFNDSFASSTDLRRRSAASATKVDVQGVRFCLVHHAGGLLSRFYVHCTVSGVFDSRLREEQCAKNVFILGRLENYPDTGVVSNHAFYP